MKLGSLGTRWLKARLARCSVIESSARSKLGKNDARESLARIVTGAVAGEFQYETRDKKDIVKKYESLEVINDNITSPRMQKVKDLVKKYEAS